MALTTQPDATAHRSLLSAEQTGQSLICDAAVASCAVPDLSKADFDGNNFIDQADLAAVRGRYLMPGTGPDAPMDVNEDGIIDIYDIEFVAERVGLTLPTQTPTPTNTPTATSTNTPTSTPTNTPTATSTNTPTSTPTNTPTATPTNTSTSTPTNTPTDTPTNTPTNTPTDTPTDTPTNTPTNTPTDTPTNTPTNTPTSTPTNTPTPSCGPYYFNNTNAPCPLSAAIDSADISPIPVSDLYAPVENGMPKSLYRVASAPMVSTTIFSVQPATQTWHVNDVFTVTVSLSDVTNLGAFDFYLSYNGTIVTPTSITLLSPISSTGRTPIIVANEIDGTGQYVHLAVATLGLTTTQGVSGNVPLAQIVFMGLASGLSDLVFDVTAPQVVSVGPCPESSSAVDGQVLILPAVSTAIELAAFTAAPVSAAKCGNASGAECVNLFWQTMSEMNTAGFAILRSTANNGQLGAPGTADVITSFIQSRGMSGGEYLWQDRATQPGTTYAYWLQEIQADGSLRNHGPVLISVNGAVVGNP
ncbi:MAG: hypothetical protein WAU96_07840 [Anaerolineae bacterium]